MDLAKGNVTREGDKVVMRGVIEEPVTWNYEVTIFKEDVHGIPRVVFTIAAVRYFLGSITGVFRFIYGRFIVRRMGAKPLKNAGS
jgi:hypothetical protein